MQLKISFTRKLRPDTCSELKSRPPNVSTARLTLKTSITVTCSQSQWQLLPPLAPTYRNLVQQHYRNAKRINLAQKSGRISCVKHAKPRPDVPTAPALSRTGIYYSLEESQRIKTTLSHDTSLGHRLLHRQGGKTAAKSGDQRARCG